MAEISSNLTSYLEDLSYTDRASMKQSQVNGDSKKEVSNDLGKEEFLQLLVCQMQNQDPLNPQEDSDFIAQLAQFSSLEQMTNMNATLSNTSAYGMVGKEVIINHADSNGDVKEIRGTVDYVEMKEGDAYLSVNGTSYTMDELVQVMDTEYAIKSHLPSVSQQVYAYDMSNPADIGISISLGDEGYEANSVAVAINGDYIDSNLIKYADGKLTISAKAFEDLASGSYYMGFFFDDAYSTSVTDKVTIKVMDSGIVNA